MAADGDRRSRETGHSSHDRAAHARSVQGACCQGRENPHLPGAGPRERRRQRGGARHQLLQPCSPRTLFECGGVARCHGLAPARLARAGTQKRAPRNLAPQRPRAAARPSPDRGTCGGRRSRAARDSCRPSRQPGEIPLARGSRCDRQEPDAESQRCPERFGRAEDGRRPTLAGDSVQRRSLQTVRSLCGNRAAGEPVQRQ